jgi:hypothetical protein
VSAGEHPHVNHLGDIMAIGASVYGYIGTKLIEIVEQGAARLPNFKIHAFGKVFELGIDVRLIE